MKPRLTVRGMMVLVALGGLGLAAFRLHPAIGCFVSWVLCLAFIRTSRRIIHLREMGSSTRPLGVVRLFLASIVVATAILEASLMPAFCLLPISSAPCDPFSTLLGVIISALLAIPIAIILWRRLW